MRRRRWTRQMVDLVNLHEYWVCILEDQKFWTIAVADDANLILTDNVVSNEFKMAMTEPMFNIPFISGKEVVQSNNFVTLQHQSIHQMGSHEACTPSDEDTFTHLVWKLDD